MRSHDVVNQEQRRIGRGFLEGGQKFSVISGVARSLFLMRIMSMANLDYMIGFLNSVCGSQLMRQLF